MKLLPMLAFHGAKREFNARRESFYTDLAEAIEDSESITLFLGRRRDFCSQQGLTGMRLLYENMLERLDENEGKLSHVLGKVVPAGDLVALSANENAIDDKDRATGLRSLAWSISRSRLMFGVLRKAVAGPVLASPVIIAFPVFVAIFFVPQYESIVSPDQWNLWGRMIYHFSVALRSYGIVFAVAAPVALFIFVKSFATWRGRLRRKADRYLPYSLYRDFKSTDFLTALALLTKTNVGIEEALTILGSKASPWLAWHIDQIRANLQDAPDDYAGAFDTGLFSPDIHLRMVTYAERARGNFSEGLTRLGTDGLEYVHANVEKGGAKLTVVSMMVALSVIAFFYGGNTMIARNISNLVQEQQEAVPR